MQSRAVRAAKQEQTERRFGIGHNSSYEDVRVSPLPRQMAGRVVGFADGMPVVRMADGAVGGIRSTAVRKYALV